MKNLFDYATKELSQDAFLIWLFENYEDEKIGHIAKELLASMINLYENGNTKPDDITDIQTHAQAEKIDIVVDFKLKGQVAILCIEDKTNSNEHDQLKRYKEIVNGWNKGEFKDRKSFFIYYKTHDIDDCEEDRIKDANWKNFTFEKINEFWNKYQNDENILISMYAKHVVQRFADSRNTTLPKENNIDQWLSFFKNTLQKNIRISCDTWIGNYQNRYAYFCCRPSLKIDNSKMPYLEIRSRDCLDGEFARILMYKCDMNYLEPIRHIIKELENDGIFKGNYGKRKNQQVGHTKKNAFKIINETDFINETNKVIEAYLIIMEKMLENKDNQN